jgi:hypothetical protein
VIRIAPTFEHKPLLTILILTIEPPISQHSFAGNVFSKPEFYDNKKNNKLNEVLIVEEYFKNEIKERE